MAVLTKPKRPKAEVNTYGLPRGDALRRELRKVFRRQREAILRYALAGRKAWWVDAKDGQARDAHGRFAHTGGGWSNPEMKRRKGRKLDDGSGEPGRLERATDRLQATYDKHPIHATPALKDGKTGETFTAQVAKNAAHFGYRGEKKYVAQIVGSRSGLNDRVPFSDLGKAAAHADRTHKQMIRDGLKPEGAKGLSLKQEPVPLPSRWPDWHDFGLGALDMATRMTPMLTLTWEAAAQRFAPRVGLDPDEWSVVDRNTEQVIEDAAMAFCGSTNATTSLSLDEALKRTREELTAGVVDTGESLDRLTRRINRIFDQAETWRARRIAQTETSRAVHAAQEQTAIASGVVTGWKWLLSSDACPLCHAVAKQAGTVKLGQPFAVIGDDPHYSTIKFPPLHPHCNCTVTEVLDVDEQPEWAPTLVQPETGDDEEA